MLTATDVARYRRLQDRVRKAAQRGVLLTLPMVKREDAPGTEERTVATVTRVLSPLLEVQHEAATDWVATAWEAAGMTSALVATKPTPLDEQGLRAAVGWAAKPLYGRTDEEAFKARLLTATDKLVVQAQGDAIISISEVQEKKRKVRTRYALIPSGRCCAFCSVMAGRGAVYRDPAMGKFHAHCRCVLTPIYSFKTPAGDEALSVPVKGYNPEEYRALYERARAEAGGNLSDIVAEVRRIEKAEGR